MHRLPLLLQLVLACNIVLTEVHFNQELPLPELQMEAMQSRLKIYRVALQQEVISLSLAGA